MKNKLYVTWIIPILIILSNIFWQRGVLEGGQISKNLSSKLDWWGSFMPIISFSGSYSIFLFLSICSAIIFWSGVILSIRSNNFENSKLRLILIFSLATAGLVFAIQNLRDAFMLSLSMLTIGILEKIKYSQYFFVKYLVLFLLVAIIAFKYPTGFVVCTAIIYKYYLPKNRNIFNKISLTFVISCVILIFGIFLDKSLAKIVSLQESFPEQQVMLQDLASFYCWSHDINTRKRAEAGLQLVLRDEQGYANICSLLRPNAWIYLIGTREFGSNQIAAPIQKLESQDKSKFDNLRSIWLATISSDPIDYVQFKLIFATQIICVGNPFIFQVSPKEIEERAEMNVFKDLSNIIWVPFEKVLTLVGKIYIFSELVLLIILLTQLIFGKFFFWEKDLILFLFFINIINVTALSVSFVSDEARYVFPLVFVSYFWLVLSMTASSQMKQNN